MAAAVQALSVSRSALERLPAQPAAGRALAVFERSCLLASDGGEPLSLVLPDLDDGPLNVVVEAGSDAFVGIEPGMTASLSCAYLQAGPLVVELAPARTWEPRPPWPALRAAAWPHYCQEPGLWATKLATKEPSLRGPSFGPKQSPVAHRGLLHRSQTALAPRNDGFLCTEWRPPPWRVRNGASVKLAGCSVPAGSLLELLYNGVESGCTAQAHVLCTAREAAEALAAGWAGDAHALVRGARQLAGLGGGLTPAGDDFLAGLMLRAWLDHPAPEAFCRLVVEAAAPRTTALSAAFLRASARGECSAAWHALLDVLAGGEAAALDGAVRGVLAHGHTSGADMLAGFLGWPD